MLDWLGVRIPQTAQFSPKFSRFLSDVRGEQIDPFRPSKHYERAADLEPFGYPMNLHLWSLHRSSGHNPRYDHKISVKPSYYPMDLHLWSSHRPDDHNPSYDHKIELRGVGGMGYREMVHQIERVFDVHPKSLELMRLDVAADIPGVPVSWFHGRTLVARKQFAASMGVYTEMGKQEVQTLYSGKRPNFFRIYDKVAERQYQYRKDIRRAKGEEIPSFEQTFGHLEDYVLTRVERQMSARGVPPMLSKLGDLTKAPDFNPFEPLEIVSGGAAPTIEDVGPEIWLQGIGLNRLAEEWGLQHARGFLSKHVKNKNSGRLWKKLRPFIGSQEQGIVGITAGDLYDSYRESTLEQLAA